MPCPHRSKPQWCMLVGAIPNILQLHGGCPPNRFDAAVEAPLSPLLARTKAGERSNPRQFYPTPSFMQSTAGIIREGLPMVIK